LIITDLNCGTDDSTALIEPESGRRVSAAELREEVATLAGKLAAAGIERGDRVSLILPDGPQFVRFVLATTALGAAVAPLNPGYTADEFHFYLEDLEPRFVLTASGEATAARTAVPHGPTFIDVDGDGLAALAPADHPGARSEDVALVLHTSGTTSRPKQVPLRHQNLVTSARAITEFYGLGESDVSFCAMPLFHVHGLVASVLAALAGGGSVIVPSRFVPGRFLRFARENNATWVSAGPTLHSMILDKLGGERVPTLRFTRSCSSALSAELFERCEAAYGVPMVEAYGMTEASHQMSSNPLPPRHRKVGSVGVPSPGVEIRIVGADGSDVDVGEVAIRGPGVTDGYVANADANAQSFFGDHWFRTGDRGRFDADGYLVLEGRIKELIIRGGENISPFEIEDALAAHPLVADSVAFAIPDPRYGEEVGAAVVLSGDSDEAALRSWCGERLAAFKVPRRIFVLEEIPRTPTGKLQRARIGAKLLEDES
jgi:acyl-CoA synthetase (AMP-forming)/AMP-acid ligase II